MKATSYPLLRCKSFSMLQLRRALRWCHLMAEYGLSHNTFLLGVHAVNPRLPDKVSVHRKRLVDTHKWLVKYLDRPDFFKYLVCYGSQEGVVACEELGQHLIGALARQFGMESDTPDYIVWDAILDNPDKVL
jgi:hypothetical protein